MAGRRWLGVQPGLQMTHVSPGVWAWVFRLLALCFMRLRCGPVTLRSMAW